MRTNELKIDTVKIDTFVEQFATKVSDEISDLLKKEISLFDKLILEANTSLNNGISDPIEHLPFFEKYNNQLKEFLAGTFNSADQISLKDSFRDYIKDLEVFISDLPKEVILYQDEERFQRLPGDSFRIRILKKSKKVIRNFQTIGLPVINFLRRIFGREQIQMPEWKHKVASRQIFRNSYRNIFLVDLLPVFQEALSNSNSVHYRLMQMDSEFNKWFFTKEDGGGDSKDPNELIAKLNSSLLEISKEVKTYSETIRKRIQEASKDAFLNYKNFEKISGTVEYPDAKSSVRVINRNYKGLTKELETAIHNYGNSSLFIFDEWRFDTSINGLSIYLLKEKSNLTNLLEQKYKADLNDFSEKYNLLLSNTKALLDGKINMSTLRKIHNEFKSGFASLLILTLSSLKENGLPFRIRNISRTFASEVSKLPDTRVFIKKFDASKSTKDRDIIKIRPADILKFEISFILEAEIVKISATSMKHLESLYSQMTEIGSVAEFSIVTAIQQIKDLTVADNDPLKTVLEGLARSEEKLALNIAIYKDLKILLDVEMLEVVQGQVKRLQELRENENLIALNMQLVIAWSRRRMIERIRIIRKKSRSIGKNYILSPGNKILNIFRIARSKYRMVLSSDAPESISAELSAYLSESKNAISRLPYIYQRLYLIEPLSDDLFYYAREKEAEQLNSAITYWENKPYSPVVIVCEKGSGATSFINHFRKGVTKYPTVQLGTVQQLFTPDVFFGFLSEQLNLKHSNLAGIIEQLNEGEERIIFLEDLQYFYLRTVDGFNSLKSLFTLMSQTNEKVLWVTSCTKYAWEYLEHTLKISSYFNFIIRFTELNDASIRELILKRHKISGYNIKFLPNKIQEKSRQFRKLAADKKQEYLEEKYFANMNKFAKGNISLALYFWLRSTKEVQEKHILMSSLYASDNSFLNTLTTNHLVVLTMICLHDGINAQELALITRKPEEESERILNQLFDDSIIVKRDKDFLINPLLYRHVIEFLKNKNFIH